MRIRLGWLSLGLVLVCSVPSDAQLLRSLRLETDNDYFNFWRPPNRRPDHDYTHGSRVSAEVGIQPWWAGVLGWSEPICGAGAHSDSCILARVEVGQELYTPYRDAPRPIPGERPYAGWLYFGIVGRKVGRHGARTAGVRVGVTGPPALAEEAQDLIHRWFGFRKPLGWARQIPFEPGVVLLYEEVRAWGTPGRGWSVSIEPEWGGALGNIRTGAHAGVGLRLARNAARPYGWRAMPSRSLHAYVDGRVHGQWVLRNLFLDGSTWRESAQVEKIPLVFRREFRAGVGWRSLGLEYGAVRISEEYRTQIEPHTYSSIVVVVRP